MCIFLVYNTFLFRFWFYFVVGIKDIQCCFYNFKYVGIYFVTYHLIYSVNDPDNVEKNGYPVDVRKVSRCQLGAVYIGCGLTLISWFSVSLMNPFLKVGVKVSYYYYIQNHYSLSSDICLMYTKASTLGDYLFISDNCSCYIELFVTIKWPTWSLFLLWFEILLNLFET